MALVPNRWDYCSERPSQRSPSLVMTLPFDQDLVQRYITDAVLDRTQRQWVWFEEAQRMNPALGTLQYLPAEVRRVIWKYIFHCRETLSGEGLWEYDCGLGSIFNLSAYYFGFGRREFANNSLGSGGLRIVSSAIKEESDDAFLSFRTFRFNEARTLTAFLKQLTPALADRIFSIEIGICAMYYLDPWMDPIMRLPSGLRSIRFRLYPIPAGWYNEGRGAESLTDLGKLLEKAAFAAPEAAVSVSSTICGPLPQTCQAAVTPVLERLEQQKILLKKVSSSHPRTGFSMEPSNEHS